MCISKMGLPPRTIHPWKQAYSLVFFSCRSKTFTSMPEILRRSVATRANFFRPKPFENHFNAEPPSDKAVDHGSTSFPDEVSGARQEA